MMTRTRTNNKIKSVMAVVNAFCKEEKVTLIKLRNEANKNKLQTAKRNKLVFILSNEHGLSTPELGVLFNRNHATIHATLRKLRGTKAVFFINNENGRFFLVQKETPGTVSGRCYTESGATVLKDVSVTKEYLTLNGWERVGYDFT